MDEKTLMLNVLTKYFNKTDEELEDIIYDKDGDDITLKEGVADALIDMDAERIKKIKSEVSGEGTKKFEEGFNKAKKETLTKFEKELKEKYGLETDLTGLDLINLFAEELGTKGGEITEDNIKTHPIYIKLEKEWNESAEQKVSGIKTEFDEFKANVEKNKKLVSVKSAARSAFLKLNPVLSDDPARAENQTQEFLNKLAEHDYIIDGDTILIKDGDGRLEDGHGNPTSFETFVKSKAEALYDFKVQDQRDSPGNQNSGGGSVKKKITKEEYNKKVIEAENSNDDKMFAELAEYEVV